MVPTLLIPAVLLDPCVHDSSAKVYMLQARAQSNAEPLRTPQIALRSHTDLHQTVNRGLQSYRAMRAATSSSAGIASSFITASAFAAKSTMPSRVPTVSMEM